MKTLVEIRFNKLLVGIKYKRIFCCKKLYRPLTKEQCIQYLIQKIVLSDDDNVVADGSPFIEN